MAAPKPKPPASRNILAGGSIIWRAIDPADPNPPRNPGDIEVLVVHRPKYDDWSWPKGKREGSEPLICCATREVEEETGEMVRLGQPLTTQRYQLGTGITKEVHYWLGTLDLSAAAGLARYPAHRASVHEIDETRWVKPNRAMKLLTRRGDRRLLDEVLALLEARQLRTFAQVFLRHGKSVSRADFDSSESARTLNRIGVSQALTLVGMLSAYGVSQVVTSPWRRCLATVMPYASLTGAEIELNPAFTETAVHTDAGPMRAAVREGLNRQVNEVFCLHRPTIPGVIGELAPFTPNALGRLLPQSEPYLKTAQLLVTHFSYDNATPQIVAIEKHRP